MLITWDPGLSVGHQKLDSDHRRFIGILNSLHEAVTVGNGRCVIGEILCDLAEYARGHFSDEEYLMQRSQYNGYIEHRQEHLKFVNELSLLIRDFEFRRTDVAEQTLVFLSQWLIKHILLTDKKMALFLGNCSPLGGVGATRRRAEADPRA